MDNQEQKPPRRLTVRQKKFVKLAAKTGNTTQAYITAYDSNNANANANANRLMKRPEVQTALDTELEKLYPTLVSDTGLLLQQIVRQALESGSVREKREAIKLVASLKGWEAPKKTRTEKLSADLTSMFRPPKE